MNGNIGKSFGFAWKGVVWSLEHNTNLRIHFVIAFLVVLASIFFGLNGYEVSIVFVMILLVISAEMINTSLEEMTNLIVSEHRKEAEIAKDVAAGMVLVTAFGSVVIGVAVFLPHILLLISTY